MVLTMIGGFLMLIGSVGLGYSKIIKKIKMMMKTEAEYYDEKFNKDTPKNDQRIATRDAIFALFIIAGSIMVLVSAVFY
jgi:uncharacterized membrane protein SpoIIM required for sporulation